MSYSTTMWAVITMTLMAVLMFASTNLPAPGHNPSPATAAAHGALVLERNLHTDLTRRVKRSVEAFVPLLALLLFTLVVLDSIEDKVRHRRELAPEDKTTDLPTSVSVDLDEWPREFDLDTDANGWIQVAREPQAARYGGN